MALADDNFHAESLPLLRAMAPEARGRLLSKALVHSVPAGVVLFDQGETQTFQHVLLSGAVELLARSGDGVVLIEIVQPPDLLLPAAVATASPALSQARTLGPARLLLIEAEAFRQAMAVDVALAGAVIASLSGQFRRMVRQIKNLKLRTSTERAGCYVLDLARSERSDTVVLPREKGMIASELGMKRESFSRALGALRKAGLSVRGEVVKITDRAALERACRPDPLIDGEGPGG